MTLTGLLTVMGIVVGGAVGWGAGTILALAYGNWEVGSLDSAAYILGGTALGAVAGGALVAELVS